MYRNREQAGKMLARALVGRRLERPVVLALPRGGVPVGYEVATALGAPLDVLIVRKIGAPFAPEFGVGAVVGSERPLVVLDRSLLSVLDLHERDLRATVEREKAECRRRERLYRGDRAPIAVKGRTVVVVDDGVATGSSVRAALRALRGLEPARVVLAVPVAAPSALAALQREADEVICPLRPVPFHAVGQFYEDFRQVSDPAVIEVLRRARGLGAAEREARPEEVGSP